MLLYNNRPVFKEITSTKTLRLLRNPTFDNFQIIIRHICNQQAHQSNWIMQEIHKQLQKSQGQQEIIYSLHKR